MNRLTERMTDGTAYVKSETGSEGVGHFTTQRRLPELIARLAAYEDTGLVPEEVNVLKLYAMGKAVAEIEELDGISIERLQDLAKADKEGRLTLLPCKVGDTVYVVDRMTHSEALASGIPEHKGPGSNRKYAHRKAEFRPQIVRVRKMVKTMYPGFGRYVFLTREEAEAALLREE